MTTMQVTFTRTAERRYRVSVDGPGVVPSFMEPAPGYDARLPHDMAHFVVEREMGIAGGVFGQLAQGGHANTFRPQGEQPRTRVIKRGNRLADQYREDGMLSEKIVGIAWRIWNSGGVAAIPAAGVDGVSAEDLRRICRAFDEVSAAWSRLRVGESMTLAWSPDARGDRQRPARRRRA
jgi:hypothetical protein